MNWFLYAIAALIVFGAVSSVHRAAEQKSTPAPSGRVAATVVLIDAAIVVVLVIAALRLSR